MEAILIHGMGRTPASMLLLAARLRAAGMRPRFFAYVAALESWQDCLGRLEKFVGHQAEGGNYILVGHSLGSVLIRGVLPRLATPPAACFFLAPPCTACAAARRLAPGRLYRLATGDMGQRLADPAFMASLPRPTMPTRIYAGIAGPRGAYSPFGPARNDGVLALRETRLKGIPVRPVPSLHTFIMNARRVADDIVADSRAAYRREALAA